jgi:hypothetical protein
MNSARKKGIKGFARQVPDDHTFPEHDRLSVDRGFPEWRGKRITR